MSLTPITRDTHKTKEAILVKVASLLNSLQILSTHPLSEEARQGLTNAIHSLKELPDLLAATSEQARLAALYDVSQSLGSSLNLEEVLTQAMDAVISLTGAERGFLMLLDPDTSNLRLRAARNFEQETLQRKDAVSRTVIDSVMRSGKPVLTTDALTDPRFSSQESVILHALRSILCVPLRNRGQVTGVIYVDNRVQSGLFTNEDLDLLNAFAAQAAIAIENARLYSRTDQALSARLAELETLTQIDRELNARLEFSHVLQITHAWALRGAAAEEGWLAIWDAEVGRFDVAAGPEHGFPLETPPDHSGELPIQMTQPGENTPAQLCAPVTHAGKLIGVLLVRRRSAFLETEAQFLARLAYRAANALENARLYSAVQQANQEKSKFVSVVTHELRIPMTSIKGYADLLRQGTVGPVNEQQVKFLETIRNNVERMSALVSDLADISRIETGRLKLEPGWVQLKDVVEEIVSSLQPKFDEMSQKLVMELPEDLPPVYADRNRVAQVLTNLLSNAHKYTPNSGEVRLSASRQENKVRLWVSDTGIGISAKDQALLFTQFFRSHAAAVREQQGWGLGLSVTKRLVELMLGEIGVESELGRGSTFWFSLPTTQEQVAADPG